MVYLMAPLMDLMLKLMMDSSLDESLVLMVHRMEDLMDLMMKLMMDSSLNQCLVSLIEHLMATMKARSSDVLTDPLMVLLMTRVILRHYISNIRMIH